MTLEELSNAFGDLAAKVGDHDARLGKLEGTGLRSRFGRVLAWIKANKIKAASYALNLVLAGTLAGVAVHGCVAPQPPDPPPPDPPPHPVDPKPKPVSPIVGDGYRVLMVYEKTKTADLTPGQHEAIFGIAIRDYLDSKCAKGSGQWPEYRIWDKDTKTGFQPKYWVDPFTRAKSVPWLVVANGKDGYEGPMPADDKEIWKILKQFGGE